MSFAMKAGGVCCLGKWTLSAEGECVGRPPATVQLDGNANTGLKPSRQLQGSSQTVVDQHLITQIRIEVLLHCDSHRDIINLS